MFEVTKMLTNYLGLFVIRHGHALKMSHCASHMCGITHAEQRDNSQSCRTTFAEVEPGYLFPFLLLHLTSRFPVDKPATRQANAQAPLILKRWLISVTSSFLSFLFLRIVYSLWQ